jgi:hypothetical protein
MTAPTNARERQREVALSTQATRNNALGNRLENNVEKCILHGAQEGMQDSGIGDTTRVCAISDN